MQIDPQFAPLASNKLNFVCLLFVLVQVSWNFR